MKTALASMSNSGLLQETWVRAERHKGHSALEGRSRLGGIVLDRIVPGALGTLEPAHQAGAYFPAAAFRLLVAVDAILGATQLAFDFGVVALLELFRELGGL